MSLVNLLRIDDILFRTSRWFGFAWFLGSSIALLTALNTGEYIAATFASVALSTTAPLGILFAGFKLRQRENRAWSLHRLIDDHVEIPVSDLLRDSDFTPASLDRAIRDLNNAGASFLVWDRKNDVIQDGRLRSARIVVDDCEACGAKISIALRIGDLSSALCPFCHDPIATEQLIEDKARLIDELDADPSASHFMTDKRSNFSVVAFIALSIVFWPAAIGYAFWKWQASQQLDA